MTVRDFTQLRFETSCGTAWITLSRPEKLNALGSTLYTELKRAFRLVDVDASIDTAVLTGDGRAFTTGGDLEELLELLDDDDPLRLFEFEDSFPFEAMERCRKTVIVAVNGLCLGGGLCLVALSDIAIAASNARFGIPEARIGLASSFLPRLLHTRFPTADIAAMAHTGAQIDAAEAYRFGFLYKVVEPEQLVATTDEVVAQVKQNSAGARAIYKRILNSYRPAVDMRSYYEALRSDEFRSRTRAFVESHRGRREREE